MALCSKSFSLQEEIYSIAENFLHQGPIELMDLKTIVHLRCDDQWTFLHYAISEDKVELSRILLENGADVNAVNDYGSTPLHIACNRGIHSTINLLLGYNPNLNIQDAEHDTPLNKLITWTLGFKEIIKRFLDAGANPNLADHQGYTPLHSAIAVHDATMAFEYSQLLVKYGADANMQAHHGLSALHAAILEHRDSVIELFLDNGAFLNNVNENGETEVDLAFRLQGEFPRALELIGTHIVKQHCCDFEVNRRHLQMIYNIEKFRQLRNECVKELFMLKRRRIGHLPLTFYSIFRLSPDEIGRYLRDPNVYLALNDSSVECYKLGDWLIKNIQKGLSRYTAFSIGDLFFKRFFNLLSQNCVDRIMTFLSNDDLYKLNSCISSS